MKQISLLLACLTLASGLCIAEPARKAIMGATGVITAQGMAVNTTYPRSTMSELGLRKGDTLKSVNDFLLTDRTSYYKYISGIRSGEKVSISFKRGKTEFKRTGIAVMRPYDKLTFGEVDYDWLSLGDCRLRTIVRKPKGMAMMPAILLIPGYTCSSVENYGQGFTSRLIETWIKAGFAVVTVEKTGMGDSYGCIDCIDADLMTDVKVFDAAYQFMERLPYADKKNLFIWGHSMGGVIAPLVAEKHQPRAVIPFATVYRPWSEFLLEMHRVQAPLDGKSYPETEDFVRLMQKVYYEYFRLKKSPAELFQNPEYKEIVASELEYKEGAQHMWGRHWRFWQQLDSIDLARSWANVDAKVLSVFGGADYIACSRIEHELIVRTVNSTHPGNAEYLEVPDVDHLITRNPDWESAHRNISDPVYREANFHQGFADTVTAWMVSNLKKY